MLLNLSFLTISRHCSGLIFRVKMSNHLKIRPIHGLTMLGTDYPILIAKKNEFLRYTAAKT